MSKENQNEINSSTARIETYASQLSDIGDKPKQSALTSIFRFPFQIKSQFKPQIKSILENRISLQPIDIQYIDNAIAKLSAISDPVHNITKNQLHALRSGGNLLDKSIIQKSASILDQYLRDNFLHQNTAYQQVSDARKSLATILIDKQKDLFRPSESRALGRDDDSKN